MEENDDDDQFQVIVFENATEVNYEELMKDNEFTDDLEGTPINNKHNESISISNQEATTKQNSNQTDDVDIDAQANAINENKVFMKYDYTHEKPWLHHTDKSAWFNYNFNERSFKNWVQHILDRRIEKAKHYQIENTDNFSNSNINDTKRNASEENIFGKYKSETVKDYSNKNYTEKGTKNEATNNNEKEVTWKKKTFQHNDEEISHKFKKTKVMEAESTNVKNITEKENFYNNHFPFNTNVENEYVAEGKEKEKEKEKEEDKKEKEKKRKKEEGRRKVNYGTEEENYYNKNENESGLYKIGIEKKHTDRNQWKSTNLKKNENHISIECQNKINFVNGDNSKFQLNDSENEKGNYDMQQFQNLINFFKENKDL